MSNGLNEDDDEQEGMLPVVLPSGALFYVHEKEFQYFKERAKRYLSDNDFQNISDFQDVDRLLILEVLCYRWGVFISMQRDYWGEVVDENTLQKSLKDHSTEIRQLKKSLGLDRETREKVRGEDSVENYLQRLRTRAKHFGYTRDKQSAKAIEILMQLRSHITLYRNCDERERIEQKATLEEVLKWLEEQAFPEFDALDLELRQEQKMWIREQ